jgi:hypothetical protein
MKVNIIFNESLCQNFVILLERSLGDDGLNILVAEALGTFNASNASMAGINVSNNVPVKTLLAGIGIVVVLDAAGNGECIQGLFFGTDCTLAHIVRDGVGGIANGDFEEIVVG